MKIKLRENKWKTREDPEANKLRETIASLSQIHQYMVDTDPNNNLSFTGTVTNPYQLKQELGRVIYALRDELTVRKRTLLWNGIMPRDWEWKDDPDARAERAKRAVDTLRNCHDYIEELDSCSSAKQQAALGDLEDLIESMEGREDTVDKDTNDNT